MLSALKVFRDSKEILALRACVLWLRVLQLVLFVELIRERVT